ncbi:hypothetical protein D5S17_04510 [Pseudonocardiaceae bacterium YIM PH 21723]|nr:hypothetical protein D5S17_04510 [Pseudonocardiaceae bacterium YIM PH 21723]
MAELGQTSDPKALVPGNAGALRGTIANFQKFGIALSNAGQSLRTLDDGGWKGPAADAFHGIFDGQPSKWIECGDAFHDAGKVLADFVGTLEWAQGQAAEAIEQWTKAEAATAQARSQNESANKQAQGQAESSGGTFVPIPFNDPGEALRAAARDTLNRARTQLNHSGEDAARVVAAARDKAPPRPDIWDKIGEALEDFGDGLWQWTKDTGELLWMLDPAHIFVDPGEYFDGLGRLATGIASAAAHPLDTAKAMLNLEELQRNPARWLGHTGPDILLTLAGGVGAVKKLGSLARGARLAGAADETAEGLMKELSEAGVKYTKDDVRQIGRQANGYHDGEITFLEKGNPKAGLEHIDVRHGDEIVKAVGRPLSQEELGKIAFDAGTKGELVGYSTGKNPAPIFRTEFEGKTFEMKVIRSENGFIVSAHKISADKWVPLGEVSK